MTTPPRHPDTPSPRHSPPFPGPRSRFPGQISFAFRSDPLNFLVRTAAEYGDFAAFRIGRLRYLLVNDPETIRDVLVTKDQQFTKSPALRQAKVTLGEGLLTSEGDFHRRQRKLSQPAFHPHRVATYAAGMVRRARQTSAEWREGEVVDLHEEMMRVTLRVVTDTLFSASVDAEVDEIGRSMNIMVAMFRRARNPFAPIVNRLPLPSNYRFLRAQAHVRATVDRFVKENRAAGVDRGDLLSTLIRARDTGGDEATLAPARDQSVREPSGSAAGPAARTTAGPAQDADGMSDEQLRDELVTLFTAGHETTANALTFAWWLVARHPAVAEKLFAEVDRELAGRDATAADVDRLPYARAVVAEAMRLYPPAWVLMRQAKQDVAVGPPAVPVAAQGVVVISQWISHRERRWWPDPDRFDPDRWLADKPGETRPRYAYFPFGGGSRNCIGEAFAWMEAILILVTLAQQWRLEDVTDKPMRLLPTITLRPKDPVWVKPRRRA